MSLPAIMGGDGTVSKLAERLTLTSSPESLKTAKQNSLDGRKQLVRGKSV
jgi:hypothetical protein